MATTEHTINDALAELLRHTRSVWRSPQVVRSENTSVLKGPGKRPDILITEPNVSPVTIETEIMPAASVEVDARSRLGAKIGATGRVILSSLAVRMPLSLRSLAGPKLSDAIAECATFEVALLTGKSPKDAVRWPATGWVQCTVTDLSVLAQSAAVPPDVIEAAADKLLSGVHEASGLLNEVAASHPGAIHAISKHLCQEDGEQTRRMAAAILTNAFVFHETLAGGPGKLSSVRSIEQLRGGDGAFKKSELIAEWKAILAVNYWPIFDIARRILEVIPATNSRPLTRLIADTAEALIENHLMRSHDLTGAVFQKLIADRKFLAAYYTTPASASLLVGLTLPNDKTPGGGSWADPNSLTQMRIADFACGTGTLLSTAYQRVGQLHELAGGNSDALHAHMMGHCLIGCDVLPAASHLTASMLAGAHPTIVYDQSSVMTVAYGRHSDGSIALGSLDLLDPQQNVEVLSVTAKAADSMGESEKEVWSSLPHSSFDLVLMNPPFTRATGHEGSKIGVPNPMFAAFGSSEDEQRLMANATKRLTNGTSAHGNAGEASIFLVLADHKLKVGGSLGLVMPLSLMSGEAWEDSRTLLRKRYADLIVVSISGAGGAELSFSADTDMGECLVVARRTDSGSKRATFVILNQRPSYPMLGANAARQIRELVKTKKMRRLEDGPVGGTPITFGNDVIGHVLDAPLPPADGWHLSRIADLSLAQTAYQLAQLHRIWLPMMKAADVIEVPMSAVGTIGSIGPYHMDINGKTSQGGIRGPFEVDKWNGSGAPTCPILWSHNAVRERSIEFDADSTGRPLIGKDCEQQDIIDKKALEILGTASHCHFNRDFRFNSQATAMQYTPRRAIGGRAWLSISLANEAQEKVLTLWGNTTLGLLLHWWHANKQQPGRGSIGKSALQTLPVLDVRALTPVQVAEAIKIFDRLRSSALLPIHEIEKDVLRQDLDNCFFRDVLGLPATLVSSSGSFDLLRSKLAAEPSVRGHKA